MRCSVCQTELTTQGDRCEACAQPPAKNRKRERKRALLEDAESPFAPCNNPSNWPAIRAFRISVCALVPVLGALLGPAAIVLASVALFQARKDPAFTARGPGWIALILGCLLTLTNWAGLVLVVLGQR